jgi:hypothetical protein
LATYSAIADSSMRTKEELRVGVTASLHLDDMPGEGREDKEEEEERKERRGR